MQQFLRDVSLPALCVATDLPSYHEQHIVAHDNDIMIIYPSVFRTSVYLFEAKVGASLDSDTWQVNAFLKMDDDFRSSVSSEIEH